MPSLMHPSKFLATPLAVMSEQKHFQATVITVISYFYFCGETLLYSNVACPNPFAVCKKICLNHTFTSIDSSDI